MFNPSHRGSRADWAATCFFLVVPRDEGPLQTCHRACDHAGELASPDEMGCPRPVVDVRKAEHWLRLLAVETKHWKIVKYYDYKR